jgi:cholesterol oxidase
MAAAYPLDGSRTAWISKGFEHLAEEILKDPAAVHFDVLIVGSGYGGAIAAATLAGRKGSSSNDVRVGVLERGKEYLPGSFPTGLREIPRHVRRKHHREGLFDIRLGPEVNVVLANGLGGGSLINAGVMEQPAAAVFQNGWPAALQTVASWQARFDTARELLGSRTGGVANTIVNHLDGVPQKHAAVKAIAPLGKFRDAEITVAMRDTTSSGNVALNKCVRCGDCATGCNFGAKNSLDVNLLARAYQQGAEIFSGATVLRVTRESSSTWLVHCVHTGSKLRARDATTFAIRARKVVLAAGALGSTEILLRSKAAGLTLSAKLGSRCSTNGDMLVVDYATNGNVHTVADEGVKPSERAIGPTITGIIDLRGNATPVVIEEMSVPAGLRLAFTEIFATINSLHSLQETDSSKHEQEFPGDDIYAVSKQQIERSALYAVMGDDGASGTVELDGGIPSDYDDGVACMRWPGDASSAPKKKSLPDLPVFDAEVETLAGLTRNKTDGRILPNPVWKLLPTDFEWLLEAKRGPLTTVHPLGGCAMADDAADGVVDDCGRVFSANAGTPVHDGLVVLDGSIIPTALGTNPALTIAAVALRAAETLATQWGYAAPAPTVSAPSATAATPLLRPVFRVTDMAFLPRPTAVEIIERLAGPVRFRDAAGKVATRIVELTLRFAPKVMADLGRPPQDGGDGVLQVAIDAGAIASRIRIYDETTWQLMERRWTSERRFEEELESIALFSAPLTGTVRVFERQKSRKLARIFRAARAWWANRGKRDTNGAFGEDDEGPGILARIKAGWSLASRSGEIRALTYDLAVGPRDAGGSLDLRGAIKRIRGHKTFTYARRANPWRQLMEVELDEFPGLPGSAAERVLKLDARYLVRIGVPLFRIARQEDGVTALADAISFFGYFLRLLLGLHIWSFRAPDKNPAPPPWDGLPSRTPDLPVPQRFDIALDPETPDGNEDGPPFAGKVVMTRFAQPGPTPGKRPLVMLHGYSASGTTFAHHAVPNNFASYFWNKGWDVWIADLRTSSGQAASAKQPWSFEQIGRVDVPAVINRVLDETAAAKCDVIAHCMGTVVFSMAVLDPNPTAANNVSNQVERAAFTQVGPLVVFSPANVFRAYVLRYFLDFLPDNYQFVPDGEPTLADDLFDRLLSTLPYPVEEFDIENPPGFTARTPWTRTRHRMDALYGRDFNLVNMESEMLRHIDDHFGALSLRTVAQTLNFVRYSLITNREGHNEFVGRSALVAKWPFPTFSVHGADNGLAHVSTVDRMRTVFADAGRPYLEPKIIERAGHQDALVGTKRGETLAAIEQFLTGPLPVAGAPSDTLVAYAPWIGPIITEEPGTPALVLRLGSSPMHREAIGVVMLRIALDGDRIVRPDVPSLPWTIDYVMEHMALYQSNELTDNRWDEFEAPLPHLMPGFQPGDSLGDGLLVLVVYAESPDLGPPPAVPVAYYKVDLVARTVLTFSPIGSHPPALRPRINFASFQLAAEALLLALQKQPPPRPRELIPARSRPGQPVLLASGAVPLAPAAVPLELPVATIKAQPLTSAAAVFGTNTTTANAVVEAIDQDDDILDGVVPYDPRPSPPSEPDPAGTRFALLSCQYPAGFLDGPPASVSYGRLLERLTASAGARPRFVVLTGDQVYVDPTAGLYDPNAQDDRYHRPYEVWLRQRSVRGTLRRVPSFMLLDDHEIDDNWEPLAQPDEKLNAGKRASGLASYEKYQRGREKTPTAFEFKFDGFPFFMLDTRGGRMLRKSGGVANAHLFSPLPTETLDQLDHWLTSLPAGPKFIVTPAMLLPRHRRALQHAPPGALDTNNPSALHSDGWDGYPETLRRVLVLIAAKGVRDLVFLSGDEHRGCVAKIELRDKNGTLLTRVHSIHTTAAYAPFPFASSLAEDFVANETFTFRDGATTYQCAVEAALPPPRDGATLLRPWLATGNVWRLDYEYADGGVQTLTL